MMVLSALRPDASLVEFLEHRARSAPVRRLAAYAITGLALIFAAFSILPFGRSVVGTFAAGFFCYAVWGLIDRARSSFANRGWKLTAQYLKLLCKLIAGLGVVAGLAFLLAVWFMALGSAWVL